MSITKSIRDVANQIKSGELGRSVAEPIPGSKPGDETGGYHTDIFNYFTPIGGNNLIYSAQNWVKIRMTLETAGPVAVSTRQDVTPVLSGKGRLLPVGTEVEFFLGRGDRLYISATAINRVSIQVEPIPWLQVIAIAIENGNSLLYRIMKGLGAAAPSDQRQPAVTPASLPKSPSFKGPARKPKSLFAKR